MGGNPMSKRPVGVVGCCLINLIQIRYLVFYCTSAGVTLSVVIDTLRLYVINRYKQMDDGCVLQPSN